MNWLKIILTLIPFIWSVGMVPFINQVHPIILGLPFLAFWLICGIFIAFICLQIIYKMDTKHETES